MATVIVEDASRFACELVVQELGIALLAKRGVRQLIASGDELTDSDDPGRKKMCQVAGAFAEYEKGPSRRQAAQRTQAQAHGDRQEGWRPDAELWPEVVAEAKRLPRASRETGERLSFRKWRSATD